MRTNLAKRFGIASLCLATAFSAFGGLVTNAALAEGTEEGRQVSAAVFLLVADRQGVSV